MKETPLTQDHVRLGGKMVDFAGWNMPVEFAGLRTEHEKVRTDVGLFDVSHMGEIRIKGDKALEDLEWVTTNAVAKLTAGKAQYSLFPNEDGGIVDDLIIYCMEPGKDYLLCVNASNKDKDLEYLKNNCKNSEVIDESAEWGQIAVQGPKAIALLQKLFGEDVAGVSAFSVLNKDFAGANCILARTGYTGEEGFEVFVPWGQTSALWNKLLTDGEEFGVAPIGLGARDSLRTEMKYSLYGNEITDTSNPYEAGLGWVVKPKAKNFIGRDKILEVKEQGLKRKLVGFKLLDKGIARHGYKVFSFDNECIGEVTSGTVSPTLGYSIGIAYVPVEQTEMNSEFLIQIRSRMVKAQVVETPFVKR